MVAYRLVFYITFTSFLMKWEVGLQVGLWYVFLSLFFKVSVKVCQILLSEGVCFFSCSDHSYLGFNYSY